MGCQQMFLFMLKLQHFVSLTGPFTCCFRTKTRRVPRERGIFSP